MFLCSFSDSRSSASITHTQSPVVFFSANGLCGSELFHWCPIQIFLVYFEAISSVLSSQGPSCTKTISSAMFLIDSKQSFIMFSSLRATIIKEIFVFFSMRIIRSMFCCLCFLFINHLLMFSSFSS